MLLIDALAEDRIQTALRDGVFDDLPGSGRPLELDDDCAVPEALRAAYRLLRNSGCLPPEQQIKNDIADVETLLGKVESEAEILFVRRRLIWLRTRLAMQGGERNLLIAEVAYREKVLEKFAE